jgi:ribosomal protein L19
MVCFGIPNTALPQFEVGDAVAVRMVNPYAPKRLTTFAGICLEKRKGKLLGASFTLRNHFEGHAVEQQFAYYSPLIKVRFSFDLRDVFKSGLFQHRLIN